ncbi:ParB/RepB/Spo0J family partition protein [Streptomyces sp. NPDC056178]|uniref:ParB/RepB/Spo0J family partition protein n=1 Tax=unclassified Streptomyces TaxID=2593676 RepID=UPI0035DBDF00
MAELQIDVNEDLAASAAGMLEGALIANIHRVEVPPLDQAKAIQEPVGVHGSQGKVAKRLGKTAAWVSQRLALLELTPELLDKVEAGELKVEPARRIGRLPKEQQAAAAETVSR